MCLFILITHHIADLENNVGYKQAVVFKPPDMDTWFTSLIVCATACGIVLASLLCVVIMRYRRQKKRFKRRQHQLSCK